MDIKIRYTWKRTSDGHMWQPIISIDEFEKGRQHFPPMDSDWEIIGRDLWIGVQDRDGTDIFNNDTFEIVQDNGQVATGVVQYGSHRREMKSGKTVDINGYAFVVRNFPTFPIAKNYLGKHDLEIIKVTGSVHINNSAK